MFSRKIFTGIVGLGLTCGLLFAGCSQWQGTWQQPGSSPAMQTNLYGNLDGWQPVAFDAKPFASLTQHSFAQEGGDHDPSVSPDGRWVVFSSMRHSPNPDLYIKQTGGVTATRLTSDPASEIQPEFSPLGDKVAYASNRSGSWDIWAVGVDGSNPVRLTTDAANDIHPSWSPDGKQIVYCSLGSRSGQWELWVVDAQSPSVKKWIGYGLYPVWSPKAEVPKIAFQQSRFRGSQWFSIWTIDFVDGEAKYPTEIVSSVDYACICPAWSPEANKLAYSTVGRAQYERTAGQVLQGSGEDVWVVDLDGRNNLRLTHIDASNFSPTWSPDGSVFFVSDRKGIENIWSIRPHQVRFGEKEPVDLTEHPLNNVQANY